MAYCFTFYCEEIENNFAYDRMVHAAAGKSGSLYIPC